MLKALGFQLLELIESKIAFNVLLSTANLHPYNAADAVRGRLTAKLRQLENLVSAVHSETRQRSSKGGR